MPIDADEYEVHLVSLHHKGTTGYNVVHANGRIEPWQYQVIQRFLDEKATQPVDDGSDLV